MSLSQTFDAGMCRENGSNSWPLKCARGGAVLLLLLCIVFPTALTTIATIILAVVLWATILANLAGEINWTARRRAVALAALLFSAVGMFWSLYGSFLGAPGAARVLTVYVIYPPLCFYVGTVYQEGDFRRLTLVFRVAALLVIGSQLAFVLSWLGADGGKFSDFMVRLYGTATASVDQEAGFTLFTLPSVSSLMFLSPFLLVDTLVSRKGRGVSAALFMLSVVACVLAGRRAIYLVLGVSLAATAFLCWPLMMNVEVIGRSRRGVSLLLLAALVVVGGAMTTGVLKPQEVMRKFSSLQSISSDTEDYERRKQFDVLVREVGESPVLGLGAGAAASYTRSNSQPWAYELTYVDALFQFGVLGFLIFCCGFIYLMACLMRAIACESIALDERLAILCFAVGFVCFLAANATNPYLGKFAYMWVVFIPVAAAGGGIDIGRSSERTLHKR